MYTQVRPSGESLTYNVALLHFGVVQPDLEPEAKVTKFRVAAPRSRFKPEAYVTDSMIAT